MLKRIRLWGQVAMIVLRLLWIVARKNPGGTYAWLARFAAEGVFGKHAQSFYLWTIGKKTKIGMGLGCAYFVARQSQKLSPLEGILDAEPDIIAAYLGKKDHA